MKLKSLYINGFGKFHDWRLEEIHPHMMILLGPNEAGKSTLMNFIKRILFGFPIKRPNTNLYPPLDGGKHGGSLTFVKSDGVYTIERYADEKNALKMIYPDGSLHQISNPQLLVGSVTEEVFRNIFAFGLDELQNFESLNNESIKDQLYSAGKGLGHLSLRDFQRSLDKKTGELYKDKGSQPEINKLFRTITEISRKLHEIESESDRYKTLQNELETINHNIENKEEERKQDKQKELHIKSLIEAWNDFRQIQEIKEQLSEIPCVAQFPENGIVLMEKELEKQESLEASIRYKQEQVEKIKRIMNGLTIQDSLLENQALITELQKRQEQVAQALDDLPLIRTQKEKETEALNHMLKEIGRHWHAENFEQIDNTLPNKEKVRHFQTQFESMQQAKLEKEQTGELLDKELGTLIRDKADNETLLHSILPDFESLEKVKEHRQDLSYLEELLSIYEEKKKEYTALLEKEALQKQINSMNKPANTLHFPMQFFLYSLFGLIMGGCLYSIFTKNTVLAWFLGGIYLPILWLFLSFRRQRNLIRDEQEADAGEAYVTSRVNALKEELTGLENSIGTLFRQVGFETVPSKTALIARREMIQDNLMKWNKRQEIETRQRRLQVRIEELENEKRCVEEEIVRLDETSQAHTEAWTVFLTQNQLDPVLTPGSVLGVFNILDTAREKKKNIHGLETRIQAMDETVQRFQDKMKQLLSTIGQEEDIGDWLPALERITTALQETTKNETEMRAKQAEEKALQEDLEMLQRDLEKGRDNLRALFKQGDASNEQDFRTNGEAYHRRNSLQQEMVQCNHHIKRISGEGASYDSFIVELQSSSYETLIRQQDDLEEALKSYDEIISGLREQKGRITKEIEQIEKKEESSALRLEKSVCIEKANILAREWATLVLAKSIMKKAIEEYEREKQPNVIKEAQHYFSLMTLGAYPSIYSPLNENVLYVENCDQIRKDIKDLSKGTAEQLYLSLRFGFIQEFTKTNEPLPIMMDDILVNFDPKRFDACCEALQSLSAEHQVLYFTCHPDSAEKMNRFLPRSTILPLP